MIDITPKYKIISSSELPGGILDSSTDGINVISSGTMVQPKKTSDSLGGLYAGASEVSQGSGNEVFKISTKGIHLGNAIFENAPFSVTMTGVVTASGLETTFLDIPDTTTANSFHVDVAGNTWWGATTLGSSTASVLNTGAATFSNVTITGGSIGSLVTIAAKGVNGDLQINIGGNMGVLAGLTLDTTGNARGTASLDIQSYRTGVTEVASGGGSMAVGLANTSSGGNSFTCGLLNVASATTTIAFGVLNTASIANGTAIGSNNTASTNQYTTAIGYLNTATKGHSSAIGEANSVGAQESVCIGYANGITALGSAGFNSAVGYGNGTSGSGSYQSAFGSLNASSGTSSVAFGKSNTVSGNVSGAFGVENTASSTRSFAFGYQVNNATSDSLQLGVNNTYKLEFNSIGNFGINGVDYQDGVAVVFLKDAVTVPTTNPASGAIIYSSSGVIGYRNSGGAVTIATTANKLSTFAATTSAELAGVISDETGSGLLVFGTTPTLTTPVFSGVPTGTVTSGVYTPTRSAEANMDANVTMTEAQYLRVGNTVTVSGRFTADPTLTTTATSFEITLPIASNIGAIEDVAGVAFCGSIAGQGAEIIGVVANDTAKIQWIAVDVTSQSWSYMFSYQII